MRHFQNTVHRWDCWSSDAVMVHQDILITACQLETLRHQLRATWSQLVAMERCIPRLSVLVDRELTELGDLKCPPVLKSGD